MNKKYAAILLLAAAAVWTSGCSPPADIIAAGKAHTGHESPFCPGHQDRF